MLLERLDALLDLSDPNIVLGPHKCRATEHLLENGNPLAYKKSKAVSSASADKDNHTSLLSLMPPLTYPTPTVPDPRQTIKCTKCRGQSPCHLETQSKPLRVPQELPLNQAIAK